MKSVASALFWIGLYLGVVLAPLLALKIGGGPPGSGFWWDFSMGLGFAAMSMMGIQFFLTARFKRATAPFGVDIIYYFHRYLAVIALALVYVHCAIIYVKNPAALGVLNPLEAEWYMTAGRVSLGLFTLLIITALWRKQLRIHYDEWRMAHIVLAVCAVALAMAHIVGVGYYINAAAEWWFWVAYTLIWVWLIVYIRVVKPWMMHKRPYHVTELREERGDSWTLVLKPQGHAGMRFKPGQFAWLTLRQSPWHIKEHPFSFSSSSEVTDRLEFTIKELGNFTSTIKDTKIGQIAYLDGPYGIFSVDRHKGASGFVFIAGGIGAAPMLSMLRTLADRQDKRPMWFLYGNNTWDEVIFREELEQLKERLDLRMIHVLDQPPEGWEGETGFITAKMLKRVLPEDAAKLTYFLCGPEPMTDAVQRGLHGLRVPMGKVHFELFDMV
ncbi:MAG: oxidoreductase [Marinosulfonomonas sp.]|nr:MAG: oxidoreductase [Marinosulfonomonas sp.]